MKTAFALGFALVLAASASCQKESAPTATSPSAVSAAASSGDVAKAGVGKLNKAEPFAEALPEGVVLDFPYHARSVKDAESRKTGAKSRQFLLEYLGMNAKAASDAVSADMARAGFTRSSGKKKKNGYNLAFTKDGYGKVKVLVRKKSSKKLRHADAKGMIKISFPTGSREEPTAPAS